ncbi:AAA family ATPase [Ferrimonas marina]|uniref:Predicted ATPase n=1 Tax=Ferrimonas marina TaxID=299255 RepID=A0A1M5S2Q6_9GAMM|nr:ATP-binding protein [Ferrimonas marina]SHH32764.1 Predicted ATPase [Ferrimonas marina]
MKITKLKLKNWRNFDEVEVSLGDRVFIVGPNASGKSNLLDALRFLRDIANTDGGGFQKAVSTRRGVKKIRWLGARRSPQVGIEIELFDGDTKWSYSLEFIQETYGTRRTLVTKEKVVKNGKTVLNRPNKDDKSDSDLLTQTHLEHTFLNRKFKSIAEWLGEVSYLHLVPQVLKHPDLFLQHEETTADSFGQSFLSKISKSTKSVLESRLGKIEKALMVAVPNLKELGFERDSITGKPHLKARYAHWRPRAGWQREDQFSDGTLRLIGLFWSLLENKGLLLLEEPELSLNPSISRKLPSNFSQLTKRKGGSTQVFITTHSNDMLEDKGIDTSEIILVTPSNEGSNACNVNEIEDITLLIEAGFSPADAVLPRTSPREIDQLNLDY